MAERPLRADAQRNREKVLQAARDAFAARGYGVPMDEIAALAGVGPGTVYRHFPTKEALFSAVTTARIEDLIADAKARAGAGPPGEAFFGFLDRLAAEATAKRDMPDAISVTGSVQQGMRDALDVLLRGAQEAGAVRPEIRATDIVVLLKALFTSIVDTPDGHADLGLRDRVFTVLADGLRTPPPE